VGYGCSAKNGCGTDEASACVFHCVGHPLQDDA
jgi:hypothetical protein